MKTNFVWIVGLSAALLAGSCGDDDKAGSCGAFTPCGGSVVGTWEIQEFCASGSVTDSECPGATSSVSGIKASGTISFNADMTTTSNMTFSGSMKTTLPASCLMGVTCAQLDAFFKTSLSEPDSDFSAASCTGTSTCECTMTFKPNAMMSSGTWRTQGNQLIDEEGESSDYCATEKELNLKPTMQMPAMMGMDDLKMGMRLTKK